MSSSENKEYSVNWKNHMSHVRKAFDNLLSTNELTDVTLYCEGKKIGAHKMLLSACSTYFRDTFKEVPCQHPVIILYGVEYSVLSDILQFIYRGEVSVDTAKLDSFLKTAQLLQISGLTDDPSDRLVVENDQSENDQSTEVSRSEQAPEEDYTETIQSTSTSEDTKRGTKRLKLKETDAPREKIHRPAESDTLFVSDVKCEPSELVNFEDPLEDPLLQSDQSSDTREFFGTGTQGDEEFKTEPDESGEFKRFGDSVPPKKMIPANTLRCRATYWRAFKNFCATRSYTLNESTSTEELGQILADWAINMRKADGTDYKEGVVKLIWNITANMLQEMFYEKYKIKFDPFRDIEFKKARDSRDYKRRQLQTFHPEKRKTQYTTLSEEERYRMYSLWDEETPSGLQRKFFHIAAFELSWNCEDAANCLVQHFKEEFDITGAFTGRIEYNRRFGSTTESLTASESKWLVTNTTNSHVCPVRLLQKLLDKRKNSKLNRLFLTPNPFWKQSPSSEWFKECPVSRNQIAGWIKEGAEKIGIDTKRFKITHYTRGPSTSK